MTPLKDCLLTPLMRMVFIAPTIAVQRDRLCYLYTSGLIDENGLYAAHIALNQINEKRG